MNGVSKVMFAFSMCDTTSGIMHTAAPLPFFKTMLSLLERREFNFFPNCIKRPSSGRCQDLNLFILQKYSKRV